MVITISVGDEPYVLGHVVTRGSQLVALFLVVVEPGGRVLLGAGL